MKLADLKKQFSYLDTYNNKHCRWAIQVTWLFCKHNMLQVDDFGDVLVSIEEASTGSVYLTVHNESIPDYNLRIADHKSAMSGHSGFWSQNLKDAKEDALEFIKEYKNG